MGQEEKWNRFVMTGKVEDYLRYRQQEGENHTWAGTEVADSRNCGGDTSAVARERTEDSRCLK